MLSSSARAEARLSYDDALKLRVWRQTLVGTMGKDLAADGLAVPELLFATVADHMQKQPACTCPHRAHCTASATTPANAVSLSTSTAKFSRLTKSQLPCILASSMAYARKRAVFEETAIDGESALSLSDLVSGGKAAKMETLEIVHCSQASAVALASRYSHDTADPSRPRTLILRNTPVSHGAAFVLSAVRNLTELAFVDARVSSEVLHGIVKSVSVVKSASMSLRVLRFEGCTCLMEFPEYLTELFSVAVANLEELGISRCSLGSFGSVVAGSLTVGIQPSEVTLKKLRLAENLLPEEVLAELGELPWTSLSSLDLGLNDFSKMSRQLLKTIGSMDDLKSLGLAQCNLQPTVIRELMVLLKTKAADHASMEGLDLGFNGITGTQARHVLNAIPSLASGGTGMALSLGGMDFSAKNSLSTLSIGAQYLTSLSFSWCRLGSANTIVVCGALEKAARTGSAASLRRVDLSGNAIGTDPKKGGDAMQAISKMLKALPQLEVLNLADNALEDAAWCIGPLLIALSKYFDGESLRTVDLSRNDFAVLTNDPNSLRALLRAILKRQQPLMAARQALQHPESPEAFVESAMSSGMDGLAPRREDGAPPPFEGLELLFYYCELDTSGFPPIPNVSILR